MKDDEVLKRIKHGDESALDFLYKKYFRMMLKMILKNNGEEDDAKDIYQDALIVFWQKVNAENLVLTSKISTYLYSICRNLWWKELERRSRHTREDADKAEFDNHDQLERIKIVNECIGMLSESCQKLLQYHYFDRLSMAEIAVKLGLANADTAKTKKYKCKKELDKKIKELYTESDFFD